MGFIGAMSEGRPIQIRLRTLFVCVAMAGFSLAISRAVADKSDPAVVWVMPSTVLFYLLLLLYGLVAWRKRLTSSDCSVVDGPP
jgi:hypothetical protein